MPRKRAGHGRMCLLWALLTACPLPPASSPPGSTKAWCMASLRCALTLCSTFHAAGQGPPLSGTSWGYWTAGSKSSGVGIAVMMMMMMNEGLGTQGQGLP